MNRRTLFTVDALLQNSNANKQNMGRRIAYHFGLEPGPSGPDDGIDGFFNHPERGLIHFQSKLRARPLDREDARSYFSDIDYHRASTSVILSGVGFKDTFVERLFGHRSVNLCRIHLLQLSDIIEQSQHYIDACNDMPQIRYLDRSFIDYLK
ncbi:TPA: hypothetical protein NGS96_002744 [Vibrio parahaemolyticus]|nr:hypothetical protein [Vibrio parahaemolyticus]